MKQYRLTKRVVDIDGAVYNEQDVRYRLNDFDTYVYWILDVNDTKYYISPYQLIESGADYIEEVKPKRWFPMFDEIYYFVATDCSVGTIPNRSSDFDTPRLEAGNYFQTKEQAEAVAKKIKVLLQEEQDKLSSKDNG